MASLRRLLVSHAYKPPRTASEPQDSSGMPLHAPSVRHASEVLIARRAWQALALCLACPSLPLQHDTITMLCAWMQHMQGTGDAATPHVAAWPDLATCSVSVWSQRDAVPPPPTTARANRRVRALGRRAGTTPAQPQPARHLRVIGERLGKHLGACVAQLMEQLQGMDGSDEVATALHHLQACHDGDISIDVVLGRLEAAYVALEKPSQELQSCIQRIHSIAASIRGTLVHITSALLQLTHTTACM